MSNWTGVYHSQSWIILQCFQYPHLWRSFLLWGNWQTISEWTVYLISGSHHGEMAEVLLGYPAQC